MAGSSARRPRARAPPVSQPLIGHFRPGKASVQRSSVGTKGGGGGELKAATPVTKGHEAKESIDASDDAKILAKVETGTNASLPERATTPPPNRSQPVAPPRTPTGPRTATLPSPDLFEPVHKSPVSVRTDPDTGKMFLMLSPSRGQAGRLEPKRATEKAAQPHEKGHGLGIFEESKRDMNSLGDPTSEERGGRRKKSKLSRTFPEDQLDNPFLGFPTTSPSSSSTRLSQEDDSKTLLDYLQPAPAAATTGKIRKSRSLALAPHLAKLYALHAAIEHSLVVHLATAGTGGSPIEKSTVDDSVSIPHLITFSALRPLVEKSSGRRMSAEDLSQLLWIWSEGGHRDIGLTVTSKRVMDPLRSSRPVLDYSIGIRVGGDVSLSYESEDESLNDHKGQTRLRRIATPPRTRTLTIDEPTSPSPSPRKRSRNESVLPARTPPQSPSSRSTAHFSPCTSSREAAESPRRGMNLVALWNNGIETRKRQVRRRLLDWSLRCFASWHEKFEKQKRMSIPTRPGSDAEALTPNETPETPQKRKAQDRGPVEGHGGLWTPGNSRESDHVAGQGRFINIEQNTEQEADFENVTFPTFLDEWPDNFPLERIAPIPCATLPSLELQHVSSSSAAAAAAAASSSMRALHDRLTTPLSSASPFQTSHDKGSTAKPTQTMTLTERIRAKEAAKRARTSQSILAIRSVGSSSNGSSVGNVACHPTMDDFKRRSMLSRLCDVSESLYMLFTKFRQPVISNFQREEAQGGQGKEEQQPQQQQQWRLPTLSMEQVIKAIMSSSKVSLSETEAAKALELLNEVVPGFVTIATVGRGKWVRLGDRLTEEEKGEEVRERQDNDAVEVQRGAESTETTMLELVRRKIRKELDN